MITKRLIVVSKILLLLKKMVLIGKDILNFLKLVDKLFKKFIGSVNLTLLFFGNFVRGTFLPLARILLIKRCLPRGTFRSLVLTRILLINRFLPGAFRSLLRVGVFRSLLQHREMFKVNIGP